MIFRGVNVEVHIYIFILEANIQAIVNVQAHLYENLWQRVKNLAFGGVNVEAYLYVHIFEANNQPLVHVYLLICWAGLRNRISED